MRWRGRKDACIEERREGKVSMYKQLEQGKEIKRQQMCISGELNKRSFIEEDDETRE